MLNLDVGDKAPFGLMDLELRDADSVQLAYGGGILFGWMHLWGGWWDVENRARGRLGRTLEARKNAEEVNTHGCVPGSE